MLMNVILTGPAGAQSATFIPMVARTSRITGRLVSFHRLLNLLPKTVETPDLRTDLVYRLRIVVTDADDALRRGMPVTVQFGDEAGYE